jgi:putative phosphoserine phosphatase/1-acylglycerol-3-phosphate O-acyltransferase
MAIAFLDFDGTLLVRDSGRICALPGIRAGLVPPRRAAQLVSTYLLLQAGLRTRTDVQLVGFSCYAGRTLDELRGLMHELHERHMRRFVSRAMRVRVAEHQRQGDRLVIVTASAFFFAEPLARELGVDEVVGTRVCFEGGRCTGRVDGDIVEGPAKLAAARRVADALGVGLEGCSFYSDHIADLPLLEAVGRPVAVAPHRPLARVARARGWAIVDHDP